jgi:serine/threonine-protein kinase
VNQGTTNIGRYEIVRPLGEGGMGTVYLARDPKFSGRHVAIKLLRESLDREELRVRFWREAQAAGQLLHPNIVTVFDWEEHEGRPFIAMEYVHGQTLARIIERAEPLALTRKVEIIEGLCAGLACAHAHDILHRDIKPANVMVDEHGIVKVLDFGIAKLANAQLTQLTMQQELLGTLSYMSPEQLQNATLDARSDLFAVAAVAYELFTYRRAFGGSLSDVTRAIILGDVPPMSDDNLSLPAVVERAVLKGLARLPEQRYDDAAAMKREFAGVRAQLVQFESPTVQMRPSWNDATVPLGGGAAARQQPAHEPQVEAHVPEPIVVPDRHGLFGARGAVIDEQPEAEAAPRAWLVRGAAAAVVGAVALTGWLLFARHATTPTASAPPAATLSSGTAPVTPQTQTSSPPIQQAPQAPPGRRQGREGTAGPTQGAQTPGRAEGTSAQPVENPAATSAAPGPSAAPNTTPPTTAPETASPGTVQPPPAPTGPPALTAADEDAVRAVLRSYEEAFDTRSTVAVKAIFPSLTRAQLTLYDRQFLDNSVVRVTIGTPRISMVSATRARVDCSITRAFTPIQGAPRQTTTRSVIVLDRFDGGWLISDVRPPG